MQTLRLGVRRYTVERRTDPTIKTMAVYGEYVLHPKGRRSTPLLSVRLRRGLTPGLIAFIPLDLEDPLPLIKRRRWIDTPRGLRRATRADRIHAAKKSRLIHEVEDTALAEVIHLGPRIDARGRGRESMSHPEDGGQDRGDDVRINAHPLNTPHPPPFDPWRLRGVVVVAVSSLFFLVVLLW